jgi:hypothetical protein
MTDQGWMVDDGTCTPCLAGRCYRCLEPREGDWDDCGAHLTCCCNEAYDLGWVAPDEGAEP